MSFALAGLVAPLGNLGAEAGIGYGRQEPRVSSRLLSLCPLRYERHQQDVSRPSPYVTLRNGTGCIRYVNGRRFVNVKLNGYPIAHSLAPPLKQKRPLRGARIPFSQNERMER